MQISIMSLKDNENLSQPSTSRKTKCSTDFTCTWRRQAFSESWLTDPAFNDWIAVVHADKYKAKCKVCSKILVAGKSELERHKNTASHQKAIRLFRTNRNLNDFVKPTIINKDIDTEIKLSLITAEYNLSFNAMQGIVESIKNIFCESQVTNTIKLKRTKCTHIINNVICKALEEEFENNLSSKYFSILVDESTDLSCSKNLCILAKYCQNKKTVVHLLDLVKITESSSGENLFNIFVSCLQKHKLNIENVIGYCSDNANVMMGRKESFLSHLLKANPNVFVIGCICHSVHLIASHAADELPKNVETLIQSLYSYFSRSPKRQALLEEIQNNMNKEKRKILNPCKTRWLALLNCVNRLLDQWSILQQTFLYASIEDKNLTANLILNELNNPYTRAYVEFMQHVLPHFNNFNLLFQSEKNLIGHLYEESKRFLRLLCSNFVKARYCDEIENYNIYNTNILLPLKEVNIGRKAEASLIEMQNETNYLEFKQRCLKFYQEAVKQAIQRLPLKDSLISQFRFINPKVALSKSNKISIEKVCSQYGNIINFNETLNEFDQLASYFSQDEIQYLETLSIEEFWLKISEIKDLSNNFIFKNITQLADIVLSLPHSNATVERVFSICSDIKTKKRNRLSTKTLTSLLRIQLEMKRTNISSHNFPITARMRTLYKENLYKSEESVNEECIDDTIDEEVVAEEIENEEEIIYLS